MLVLTRKKNETIRIGENIVIKVLRIGNVIVKLGIEAPLEIRVLRGELYDDLVSVAKGDIIDLSENQVELETQPKMETQSNSDEEAA